MRISVLVPSYRRAPDLARCLAALAAQSRAPSQMLVVARMGDTETFATAHEWASRLPLEIVEVTQSGQVHALNAGLACVTGDAVAITDDDAAPLPDWLARIAAHFESDPKIGGVGGRDWVHEHGGIVTGQAQLVGRFLWFGRAVGNHHLGAGPTREVHFLKGANCAFRTEALRRKGFDARLRGAGAQVHNDLAASLAVGRAGWKLIYDPAVAVNHFPALRYDADARGKFDPGAAADRRFNYRLAIRTGLPPWRRATVLAWSTLIGTKSDPGLLRVAAMLARGDRNGLQRHRAVQHFMAKNS